MSPSSKAVGFRGGNCNIKDEEGGQIGKKPPQLRSLNNPHFHASVADFHGSAVTET